MSSDSVFGTPIMCKECGYEDKVRLFKGTRMKQLYCPRCHKRGTMTRNTDYDKTRRRGCWTLTLTKEDYLNIRKWMTATGMMIEAKLRTNWSESERKTLDKLTEMERELNE